MESTFSILAEPSRRAIVELLLERERSVQELEKHLKIPQPSISKHLRVLREGGIVEPRVEAQWRVYRLRMEPFLEIDRWLEPYRRRWRKSLDALQRRLEATSDPRKGRKR